MTASCEQNNVCLTTSDVKDLEFHFSPLILLQEPDALKCPEKQYVSSLKAGYSVLSAFLDSLLPRLVPQETE
jgi:hypothetical protein